MPTHGVGSKAILTAIDKTFLDASGPELIAQELALSGPEISSLAYRKVTGRRQGGSSSIDIYYP